jgi:hypothetical protein
MAKAGIVNRRRGTKAESLRQHNKKLSTQGHETLLDKIYCCAIPFLNATAQHHIAVEAGKSPRAIYVEGRGAETFDACVASFRAGGSLGLVGGLRVLGSSRRQIMERLRILRERGVHPYDLESGLADIAELLNAAINKIAGGRALRESAHVARRMGRKGGLKKGIAAQIRRNAILQEDIVARLCSHPKLTWADCAEILGKNWSESTLRRKYGGGTP